MGKSDPNLFPLPCWTFFGTMRLTFSLSHTHFSSFLPPLSHLASFLQSQQQQQHHSSPQKRRRRRRRDPQKAIVIHPTWWRGGEGKRDWVCGNVRGISLSVGGRREERKRRRGRGRRLTSISQISLPSLSHFFFRVVDDPPIYCTYVMFYFFLLLHLWLFMRMERKIVSFFLCKVTLQKCVWYIKCLDGKGVRKLRL